MPWTMSPPLVGRNKPRHTRAAKLPATMQGQAQNQDPILVHRQVRRYLSANYQLSLGGASKEAGSLSASHTVMSGSNRIALKASSHSDRSRQLSVKNGNYARRWRCSDNNIIAPGGLKLRNAQALLARNCNSPDVKKSSPGGCESFEDVKPTGTVPRLPKRPIHASYDRS